jgi:hypothetical protein
MLFVFYSVGHAALQLLDYIGKERADGKLVRIFIDGSSTLGRQAQKKKLKRVSLSL